MRAREFILVEYSREKTATVFGNKLLTALQNDRSYSITGTSLDFARVYLDRQAEAGNPVEDDKKTDIINNILQTLEKADPTPNKEYMRWIANVYATQNIQIEDLLSRGYQALSIFHTYKQKRILPDEYRDIGRIDFSTLEGLSHNATLRQALIDKHNQEAAKTLPRGDAEMVYENSQVRVIHPKDEDAACYYGQGTLWCTSTTESTNYFDNYNSSGPLYILLPKNPSHEGEKYQLHFSSGQFTDEDDEPIAIEGLLTEFGNDLLEFFIKVEPDIKDWLIFAPDETLEPLITKIKTAVKDYLYEMVSEWEVENEYWYEYLRDKGYVYPEGHEDEGLIDWDKAAEAGESYLEWDYETGYFVRDIKNAVDLTPQEVKNLSQDIDRYDFDALTIEVLDQVFAYAVEQSRTRNEGDGGIADWIHKHIYIKKRGGEWDVSLIYRQKDGKSKEYPIHT